LLTYARHVGGKASLGSQVGPALRHWSLCSIRRNTMADIHCRPTRRGGLIAGR